jgi:TetR/AcrR family transcriptional repressor of nem operon
MNDMRDAIMDAAEKRIRVGGFNGFSFREIATDVGVKSSSVHYYFPTKDELAAAVIHRYKDQIAGLVSQEIAEGFTHLEAWTRVFRGTLQQKVQMCPCTVLGSVSKDLPPAVASAVKEFFQACIDGLVDAGLTSDGAVELLAKFTGALVVATALDDMGTFDRATNRLPEGVDGVVGATLGGSASAAKPWGWPLAASVV